MAYYFDRSNVASLPLDIPAFDPLISAPTTPTSGIVADHQPLSASVSFRPMILENTNHTDLHIALPPSNPPRRIRFSGAHGTILQSCQLTDGDPDKTTTNSSSPSKTHFDNDDAVLWYTPDDLNHWRMAARQHCRAIRSSTRVIPGTCTLSVDPALRGLEQRACLERQRRRFLVTKCVLQQQRKRKSTQLAKIVQQFTEYATQLAVEEAAKDFAAAYCSEASVTCEDTGPEVRTANKRTGADAASAKPAKDFLLPPYDAATPRTLKRSHEEVSNYE